MAAGDSDLGSSLKLFVLGKCHVRGIAASWSAMRPSDRVKSVTWVNLRKGYGIEKLIGEIKEHDLVVVQGARSGGVNLTIRDLEIPTEQFDELSACLAKAILFPAQSFTGFHPDMARAYGSAYSKLALAAFSTGLPRKRAGDLYNAFIYATLGYFDEYAKAERFSVSYGEACGVDLAPLVAPNQGVAFMHNPHQPTIGFWWRLTKLLCDKLGLAFDDGAALPADPAGHELMWPVYPEIAERVGVEGSLSFRLQKEAPFVDLQEMLDRSWEMFETMDFEAQLSSPRISGVVSSLAQAGV